MLSRTLRSGLSADRDSGSGAAQFGNLYRETTDERRGAAVDAAWDAGIRYFDTAPHYGLGLSERRLGAALADRPRDEYVLSTKVGRLLVPSRHRRRHDGRRGLRRARRPRGGCGTSAATASAARSTRASSGSGLDRIDIAYLHDPDDHEAGGARRARSRR